MINLHFKARMAGIFGLECDSKTVGVSHTSSSAWRAAQSNANACNPTYLWSERTCRGAGL